MLHSLFFSSANEWSQLQPNRNLWMRPNLFFHNANANQAAKPLVLRWGGVGVILLGERPVHDGEDAIADRDGNRIWDNEIRDANLQANKEQEKKDIEDYLSIDI